MPPPRPIDRFWAGFFGVDPAALETPGVAVVPHAALAGYAGLWFFVRGDACIVSAPPAWCAPVEGALREQGVDSLLSPDGLEALFGDALAGTVGPAWHGWLEPGAFRPVQVAAVRELEARDADGLSALRAAAGETAWQHAGLRADAAGAFGWLESGELLAAASLSPFPHARGAPGVVGPGVLTRPDRRRAGCGTAVVSAAVAPAVARGDLVVYQTLMENDAARGIARRLGFAFYATHLAVRLAPRRPG